MITLLNGKLKFVVVVYRSYGKVTNICSVKTRDIKNIVYDTSTDSMYEYDNENTAEKCYQDLKKIYNV
jgi:hypothetical protein